MINKMRHNFFYSYIIFLELELVKRDSYRFIGKCRNTFFSFFIDLILTGSVPEKKTSESDH